MKEYIFNVETVSPLMLGNADSQPELRATAVRASARYWFRATAGAVIGDTSTQTIFNMEKAVFGCAKEGSPISIFIPNVTLNPYPIKMKKIIPDIERLIVLMCLLQSQFQPDTHPGMCGIVPWQ